METNNREYSQLKKGSYIAESQYGMTVFSTITSEVEDIGCGMYAFKSMSDTGGIISYIVGGTYSPNVVIVNV